MIGPGGIHLLLNCLIRLNDSYFHILSLRQIESFTIRFPNRKIDEAALSKYELIPKLLTVGLRLLLSIV